MQMRLLQNLLFERLRELICTGSPIEQVSVKIIFLKKELYNAQADYGFCDALYNDSQEWNNWSESQKMKGKT